MSRNEMTSHTRFEFSLGKNSEVEFALAALERWGIAHMPDYLDAKDVQQFRSEFLDFFECSEKWVKKLSYRPGWLSRGVSVQRESIDELRFPLAASIFGSDFLAAICDGYLGVPNQLNNAIYLTHDLPNPEPVTILHFDRI